MPASALAALWHAATITIVTKSQANAISAMTVASGAGIESRNSGSSGRVLSYD
jgi:hypothetical protein